MGTPKVSVIIPCFNHGEFLAEAVASVTSLKRDDVELIIVDDGSTDERTCNEIESLIVQGIKVIRQENRGVGAARNAGVLASKGEYILPLDADNRLRPGYIEHGIRVLNANPEVGVVYSDAEYIGIGSGRGRVGAFDRNRLLLRNYIDACAVYRRSVWELNKGYDSGMPVQGFEDWDFWLGALEHGWQFAYLPEVFFDYRESDESMITRTRGFEGQIGEFVARKHALLYRNDYVQLGTRLRREESVRWTLCNLYRLLKTRLMQKMYWPLFTLRHLFQGGSSSH
jgi:glycosyltransferase involved in cell wall biosynthesis